MAWLFLICATIGGTILVCQFVLALVGFGADVDVADDLPDDVPHDFPHLHTDAGHDAHPSHAPDPELGVHGVGHGNFSTWLFGMLSFKTITAALAFFGFAGCAAESAGMGTTAQIVIATLAGMAALYGVHSIMQLLFKLSQDNTIRLHNAVGKEGTVYLTIPANRRNTGKVQFKLQSRLVEYPALTDHDEPLKTGARVRIVALASGSTLQVEPYVELKSLAAESAQAN